jgi:hypothetical protein
MKKSTIELASEIKYEVGDFVYLKTDPDQYRRMVLAVLIRAECVAYGLGIGTGETYHYEIEITTDKNILEAM